MSKYQFTPQAVADFFDIWSFIAEDNPAAAYRVFALPPRAEQRRIVDEVDRRLSEIAIWRARLRFNSPVPTAYVNPS
jgi:plasmid stabilization system protein ParE